MFLDNVYWAKDVIFLVVDKGEIGIQSWLDEYHGVQSKCKFETSYFKYYLKHEQECFIRLL